MDLFGDDCKYSMKILRDADLAKGVNVPAFSWMVLMVAVFLSAFGWVDFWLVVCWIETWVNLN